MDGEFGEGGQIWQHFAIMMHPDTIHRLREFRDELYMLFGKRADALFELCDAAITVGQSPSLVYLSLEAAHRRSWGSLYDALVDGQLEAEQFRSLLSRHPLAQGQPVYAVDVSAWPRRDATTSPERGFHHHNSRHTSGRPVVAGWAYQWIAQVSFAGGSWTAPLDVRRPRPGEDTNLVAVEQIKGLVARRPAGEEVPLFVFDAGYDPIPLSLGLADSRVAILVRLHSNRCYYGDPCLPEKKRKGPTPRHGAKFTFRDPTTWHEPTKEHTEEDERFGKVRVRAWAGLHSMPKNRSRWGEPGRRPLVRGTVILVEVGRLPGRSRRPEGLWLFYFGPGEPDLASIWRAYVHRFDLEHTFRFLKQTLNWTKPRVRYPEQADLWTWLVVAAYTQLRLARSAVADRRLPWERPLEAGKLTPNRVRSAFSPVLATLGSPANGPKACGRSPGRPKGRISRPATRYPVRKKAA